MANSGDIVALYTAVFEKQKAKFSVIPADIIRGIKEIGEAYRDDPTWEVKEKPDSSSTYQNAGHRCAYLHKYAMVHTGLLCEVLDLALKVYSVTEVVGKTGAGGLSLCSLGSGPGTDIVAFLFILNKHFGPKRITAAMVDCCEGWKDVFETILSELKSRDFINDMVSRENFSFEYVDADLLNFYGHEPFLCEKIKRADMVTMVKFVSTAGCKDTKKMLKNIVQAMKPGALLLFVDNAAGGYYEMMLQTAKEGGMESVYGPVKHHRYEEKDFCLEYRGKESQWRATVAAEIWKKPIVPLNTTKELVNQFFSGAKFAEGDFPVLGSGRIPIRQSTCDEVDSFVFQRASVTHENISEKENGEKCCTIM